MYEFVFLANYKKNSDFENGPPLPPLFFKAFPWKGSQECHTEEEVQAPKGPIRAPAGTTGSSKHQEMRLALHSIVQIQGIMYFLLEQVHMLSMH